MADWYVSPTGDDNTGDGSSGNPYKHIHKAIDEASSNDTIKCNDGTYDEEEGRVLTSKNIKIESISSNFENVIIKPLSLVQSFSSTWKSWIHVISGSLIEIYDVTIVADASFINNETTYTGILTDYAGTGVLAVRCFFLAQNWSGRLDGISSGSNGVLRAYKCTFRGFSSTDARGVQCYTGGTTVTDTIFEDCYYGIIVLAGTLTETYNCFYNNTTDISGDTKDATDITDNPNFVSAESAVLNSGSACEDAGITIATYVEDYEGEAPDIGCYELIVASVSVATNSATNINISSATLNGTLSNLDSGESANVWFEYWEDTSGASVQSTSPQERSVNGAFSANITGLDPNTTYKFQAKAQNTESGSSEVSGDVESFTTLSNEVVGDIPLTLNVNAVINRAITIIGDIPLSLIIASDVVSSGYSFVGDITLQLILSSTYSYNWSGSYCTRIIHTNPLIVVCDTNPVKLIKITLDSSGDVDTVTLYTLTGLTDAMDFSVNETFDRIYVACANGKVGSVQLSDPSNFSIIDLSDTDNGSVIDCIEDLDKVFIGMDSSSAELYELDNAETKVVNTHFTFIQQLQSYIRTVFAYINAKFISTKFVFLQRLNKKINTDFRYTYGYDSLTPTARSEFTVEVDSVELGEGDIVLDSIEVNWNMDELSDANFTVARKHDDPDHTLVGGSSEISNKNDVVIYFNSIEIFTGSIETLDCSGKDEEIKVFCKGTVRNPNYITVDLPLASTNEQRHLYHIIDNNVEVVKPYLKSTLLVIQGDNGKYWTGSKWNIHVDNALTFATYALAQAYIDARENNDTYDTFNAKNPVVANYDENPAVYRGIRIDLGTEEEEIISRWTGVLSSLDAYNNYVPKQNWTYFWSATCSYALQGLESFSGNWLGLSKMGKTFTNRYLGTSLGGLSDDLWVISSVYYRRQRVYDNTETELGYYYLGSSPYKEVSAKNGRYISHYRWEDRDGGLYFVKGESYDYVSYARQIAGVEYAKLKNSNDVAPNSSDYAETTATITLTLDALLYYNLGLLTKINIVNTTESGIYEDNNGFPLRIKQVKINSVSMKTTLTLDNTKTQRELEDLDETYPDEPEVVEETATWLANKFDPSSYGEVV